MTTTFPAVFDAWNRLVALTVTGQYVTTVSSPRARSGHRRFDPLLLLQQPVAGAGRVRRLTIHRRYVWGLPTWTTSCCGTAESPDAERFFALQDANWNVVAIYNASANAVAERFAYTAYGVCRR